MKTLLFASVICVAIVGCDNRPSRTTSEDKWEAEYRKRSEAQMEEYERQTRRATTFQDLQAEQNERLEKQNERYEKLLDQWEKNAKRQEAILDAQEKQLGIKK
jgi:thiamine biosynthesis lipoprotein ApbE